MDHLKHVHIFLAGLQVLEPPFPSTPSSWPLPSSCPSTTPNSLITQEVLGKVKSDVVSTMSPALGWGPLTPSHLTTPCQADIRIQYLARNVTRWAPAPKPPYNPSATYRMAFPACLQNEAMPWGEGGSPGAQQLAISSQDTGFS